jgi:MEMO1 family protein
MSSKIRKPAVAGHFYPANAQTLENTITKLLEPIEKLPSLPFGGIVPHAGYDFSGETAAHFYGALPLVPPKVIILGPNHTGMGKYLSVSNQDSWQTPLGEVKICSELRDRLVKEFDGFDILGESAHMYEHSIEVQLPFLQVLRPDVEILPISIGFGDFKQAGTFAETLKNITIGYNKEDVIILASSDMSHFISGSEAKKLDNLALKNIYKMDFEGLFNTVKTHDISMCGMVPAVSAMSWAVSKGSTIGTLLKYTTSADFSKDESSVVGYASVVFQ